MTIRKTNLNRYGQFHQYYQNKQSRLTLNSPHNKRHMSPVANNNNNNGKSDIGGDHDGEGENDFLFFIEMFK
jgi:hypothetical protein